MVALCQAPFLLDDPNVGLIFPADAIARAKHYLLLTSGGLGISFSEIPIFFDAIYLSFSKLFFLVCITLSDQLSTNKLEQKFIGLSKVHSNSSSSFI